MPMRLPVGLVTNIGYYFNKHAYSMTCLSHCASLHSCASRLMAYSAYTPKGNFEMMPYSKWKTNEQYNGLDPLIFHIETDFDYANLSDAILGELHGMISEEMIHELIDFGAVYLRPSSEAHKNGKPTRTTREKSSLPVPKGSYVRVSANPKRYPHFWKVQNWTSLILFESDDLLAVNKPPGCPTTETADNIVENVRKKMEHTLGTMAAQGSWRSPHGLMSALRVFSFSLKTRGQHPY